MSLIKQTADTQTQSKRAHPRSLVDWPVTLISPQRTYQGKAANISRGGALVHLSEELEVGDVVRVAFEIPDYHDVIVARGAVLRVFPLEETEERGLSHGIALKFTEISDYDLRFFTGNLAPEWKDGYIDRSPIRNTGKPKGTTGTMNYLPWFLVVVLLLPLSFFLYDSFQRKIEDENSIIEIDKRLLIIEAQLRDIQDSIVSTKAVERQLNDLEIELSYLKKMLPETVTLETVDPRREENNINQDQGIHNQLQKIEDQQSAGSLTEQSGTQDSYYEVKSDDNSPRISKGKGITIRELKEINNSGANDIIVPGQKSKLEQ